MKCKQLKQEILMSSICEPRRRPNFCGIISLLVLCTLCKIEVLPPILTKVSYRPREKLRRFCFLVLTVHNQWR